jgi:cell division protein FtsB
MSLRILVVVLLVICGLLQYRLWFGNGGLQEVWSLREQIAAQRHENEQLRERNRALRAEVQDLKKGTSAIEERARTDLGMIASGETFYQVVAPPPQGAPARDVTPPASATAVAAR